MRSVQTAFPGFDTKTQLAFGGSAVKGHAKTARTISTQHAMHIVLRSSLARGPRSFLARARQVEKLLTRQGARCGVKVYDLANAGNHLHLIVRVQSRRALHNFLRAITGLLARIWLGKERGKAGALQKKTKKFWDALPFSRIVHRQKDYRRLKNYLMLNRVETLGLERLDARGMLAKIAEILRAQKLVPLGFG